MSPYAALQRKKRNKGVVVSSTTTTPTTSSSSSSPRHHVGAAAGQTTRQATTRSSSVRMREFVWAALLVIFLTAFARCRNFAEPLATYNNNGAYGDAATLILRTTTESSFSQLQQYPIVTQRHQQQRTIPPRILRFDFQTNEVTSLVNHPKYKHKHRHLSLDYNKLPEEQGGGKKKDSNKVPLCIEMEEWQTAHFLSCNQVHETNMKSIRFINCGASRCAFQFNDIDGTAQVLKTQL
jgi:hypothetical protein